MSGTETRTAVAPAAGYGVLGVQPRYVAVVHPIDQRAPTSSDDEDAGYAVGQIWQARGIVWTCIRATAGAAVWQETATALPSDAVGGTAPLFIGGTRRYRSAYTGNLIQVVRASDSTTLDVGQDGAGGLDVAALEAFGAGTSLTVSVIYDQSGNGNDVVQSTAALRPAILSRAKTGNAYSIVFDSVRQGTTADKYMEFDIGMTGTTLAVSVFVLARCANAITQTNFASLNGSGGARNWYFQYNGIINQFRSAVTGTGLTPINQRQDTSPQIIGVVSGSNNHTMYVGDYSDSLGTSIGSTNLAGGYVGHSLDDVTHNGYYETPLIAVWGRALSDAEIANFKVSVAACLGLAPQARDTLSFYGDSITQGYGGSYLQSYGRQAYDMNNIISCQYEVGAFGQSISRQLQLQSTMTSYLGPIPNANAANNTLLIFAGSNDYASGIQSPEVFSAFVNCTDRAKDMGFTKIIWGTTLPRSDLTDAENTQRVYGNAMLMAQWHYYCDGIVDFASDPTMGPESATADTSLYVDGIHPTDLGYTYLANMAAPVVAGVVIGGVGSVAAT